MQPKPELLESAQEFGFTLKVRTNSDWAIHLQKILDAAYPATFSAKDIHKEHIQYLSSLHGSELKVESLPSVVTRVAGKGSISSIEVALRWTENGRLTFNLCTQIFGINCERRIWQCGGRCCCLDMDHLEKQIWNWIQESKSVLNSWLPNNLTREIFFD